MARRIRIGTIIFSCLLTFLGAIAWTQRNAAIVGQAFSEAETAAKELALLESEEEFFAHQKTLARYFSKQAAEFLDLGQADQALAVASSAFPDDERHKWEQINADANVETILREAYKKSKLVWTSRNVYQAQLSQAPMFFTSISDEGISVSLMFQKDEAIDIPAIDPTNTLLSVSPNKQRLVEFARSHPVRLWNFGKKSEPITLLEKAGSLFWTMFSPDSKLVMASVYKGGQRAAPPRFGMQPMVRKWLR